MKYFKTYITVLFAALLLHSCAESEISQEIGIEEGSKVYITLSIPLNGGSSTRTEGDEYDPQTPEESKISTIRLVLVNKEDKTQVYEVSSGDMNWSASGNVYTSTIPVTGITLGTYYAYVIANATPSGISLPEEGKLAYDDIDRVYTLSNNSAEGMNELSKANYFLMANKNNLPNSDFRGGIEVTLTSKNGISNPAYIEIDLERLACKVSVGKFSDANLSIKNKHLTDNGDTYYTIDGMELTGIGLLNCTTQYNLIQHWTQGSSYETDPLNLLLQSPSTIATDKAYLTTGYYNRISEYTNPASAPFKLSEEVLYCMENNSPYYENITSGNSPKSGDLNAIPGTRMKGRTTGIIFRMQAHIKRSSTSNEDIIEDDQDPSPWEKTSGVTTRASLSSPKYTTFYKYKGMMYANNSALIATDSSLKGKTVNELRKAGVEVYENGIMYYIYWIQDNHYNDGDKPYYSVMRNAWYHVAITDIKNIGSDIPGGNDYNEEDPIDTEVRDLSVSLRCAEWQLKSYENEIK